MKREYDKSIAYAEKAVAKDPNGADAHAWLGNCLNFAARPQEAIPHYEKAMRLNPRPQLWYYIQLGQSYRMLGRYEEAVAQIEKSLALSPNSTSSYAHLIFTYAEMGREDLARAAGAKLIKINPKFSAEKYAKALPYKDRDYCRRWGEALHKAVLPETPPLPLPDKPSIAVLPFVNMSGDPEQEYFSDGITEEIITALSKTPKLFVIARTSSFKYKGKEVDVRTVGRDLGVRYVLEGSVRTAADKVRITAQLVDAKTGNHLWAQRYDRDLKDIFALQDEITMKVIKALRVKLTEGEQARLLGKGTNNLEAYHLSSQARDYLNRHNKEDDVLARKAAEQAIALDPGFAGPYVSLGWTHVRDVRHGLSKSPEQSLARASQLAHKVLSIDDSSIGAHAILSVIYLLKRQHEKAIAEMEQCLVVAPNSARAHALLGSTFRYAGRPAEAIQLHEKALRLNPMPDSYELWGLGAAYNDTGQYEKAIAACKKAIEIAPNDRWAHFYLTYAYSSSGREEEARTEAEEFLRIDPKFSLARFAKVSLYQNQADTERIVNALRKAGLK
jgi:TolB-like protein/Tfp pilus assembly protein PilF